MRVDVMAIRLSKIVMTGGLSIFAFLVVLGNVTDPESNFAFVQHVLLMDSIFPDSNLTWRSASDANLHMAAFLVIIVAQGLTCLAFLVATLAMMRAITSGKLEFQRAKSLTALGVMFGFALWFVGFMAIGGEWFAMWQSEDWNGQSAAFQFYVTIMGVGIYVFLDNDGAPN